MNNYQDALNIAYGIISTAQDSSTYPELMMRAFINKAQNDICSGNIVNLSTGMRLSKQALTFLEKSTIIRGAPSSTLGATASIGDDLTITNQWNPASNPVANPNYSGYIWINGNLVSYTYNDGGTISGIPTSGDYTLGYEWNPGTKAYPLYALPTDFGQLSRIFANYTGTTRRVPLSPIDSRDLTDDPINYTNQYRSLDVGQGQYGGHYSMIRGSFILPIMGGQGITPITLEYQKKPEQLIVPTDALTIPDEYSLSTIPYLAVSEMMANRGEMDEAMKLNNMAYNNVQSMYEYYGSIRQELLYNQRVGSGYDGYLSI